ncbi:MFS transporter [Paenibacillus beijingensis]|uniref:MFS transporter n=1 Tax=Paenibacillus beijingensis TaxID=1126833 RepID=A0A0D5NLY6_9BACL|nr:MFS transporter [Paenibacillus beijingensis]AJY76145.1 MFS transporter [Paenibacillus beijingensis]
MRIQPGDSKPKLWTRNFVLFTLSNLLVYLNLQMTTVSLPAYVSQRFGAGSVTVSLIISIFAVSAILTRFFVGKALETTGRKKLLYAALICLLISTAAFYWLPSVLLFILFRFISGIGFGIATTAFGTMVSEIVPARRMGEGMGYFGLSTGLSMALAPVVGIWLLLQYGAPGLFGVATILVIAAVPLIWSIKSAPPIRSAPPAPLRTSGMPAWMDRSIAFPCVLNLLLSFTYGGLISYMTLFGTEIGVSNVGWFFLCNALLVILVRPFSGQLFDRKGHQAVLPLGGLMVFAGLLLLSSAHSLTVLLLSSVCYGIGFGTLQPSLQAWTINRAHPRLRGAANGAFFNSMDVGIAVGSLSLGVIAANSSYAMMYRASALMMVLFLTVYGWSLLQGKKSRQASSLNEE